MGNERKLLSHTAEQLDTVADKVLGGTLADKPSIKYITLSTEWSGEASPYTQVVIISGITSNSKIDIQPDSTTIAQMIDDGTTALFISNDNGVLTANAAGEKPTVELTIQATVSEVSA